MKRLLILGAAVAVVAVVAVTVAAVGGGGGHSGAVTAADPGGATVSTRQIGDRGEVLVDSNGQALYASDQETAADMVLCTDGCTSFWTPLIASDGSPTGNSISGELGVVERPDGARQVTLDGKLLYSFADDQPGEVTGDGFEDAFDGQTLTWHVVHADGGTDSSGTTTPGPYGS
jgi:predicted lipoprotein with Yx(FWY)xxD motif